ncbi:MAG: hypothetical protein ACLFUC_11665 [Bacteroidales bacterium]
MKKQFLFAIIFLSVAVFVEAQKINRIGLQSGMNLAKMHYVEPAFQDFNTGINNQINGSFGFFSEAGNSQYFVSSIGIFYQGKGMLADDYNLRFHHFQIPLYLNFRIPVAEPVYLLTGFGCYASCAFKAKEISSGVASENVMSFPKKDEEVNLPYNPLDFGVLFGGAVEINLNADKAIKIGCYYDLGIWKVTNSYSEDPELLDPFNPGLKSSSLNFSISYMFNLKKDEKAN